MRTTVNIPNDVLTITRTLAEQNNISLGEAIAVLVRRGTAPNNDNCVTTKTASFPIRRRTNLDHVITDELVAQYRDDN